MDRAAAILTALILWVTPLRADTRSYHPVAWEAEVNYVLDDWGNPRLRQWIFWDWDQHCICWCYECDKDVAINLGRFWLIWVDSKKRWITARHFRQTSTVFDPEVVERKIRAIEDRHNKGWWK